MAQFSRTQEIMLYDQLMELESFARGKTERPTIGIFGNEVGVEVKVICTRGEKYVLRVYIPPDFPNSCPSMIVIAADHGVLRRKDGSLLSFSSHRDHVLSSKDGFTRISHFPANNWVGDKTLLQVMEKGLVWLEAYEIHLRKGGSIDRFLQGVAAVFHAETPLYL